MPSFLGSPPIRLYASLAVLFFSLTSLLFLFQDSLPIVKKFGTFERPKNHSLATHETAIQHDPPPNTPPFGALVIAAQEETDLSWTKFSENE